MSREECFTPGKYYLAKFIEHSVEVEDNDGYKWYFITLDAQ